MQVEGTTLMPSMNSTNTTQAGSRVISKESKFQSELATAQSRLNKAAKSGINATRILKTPPYSLRQLFLK